MGFILFLFVLLSLLNVFFPRLGWHMRYGWMVKGDVGPSDAYLIMTRVSGVIVIIVALIFMTRF